MTGLCEPSAGVALMLRGIGAATYTTKSSSGSATVQIQGALKSGTGTTGHATNGNVFAVKSNANTLLILDEEGDLAVLGSGTLGTFDKYDDVALLNGLRASLMPVGHELRERFSEFISNARSVLEPARIVHYNDGPGEDGQPFISIPKLQMLTIDAIRQSHDRQSIVNDDIYTRMKRYERALLDAGIPIPRLEV